MLALNRRNEIIFRKVRSKKEKFKLIPAKITLIPTIFIYIVTFTNHNQENIH